MILTWRYALQSLSLVLPHLQTNQQSLSMTFSIQTHNRCMSKAFRHSGKIISGGCTNHIGCTELCCSDALAIGCSRMALVGCTRMAADMTGLLQRMLPRLDDTHLDSMHCSLYESFETPPENRNHGQAFGSCQACLPSLSTPPPDVPKDIDGDGRKEKHEHHQRHVQDGACSRVYEGGCLRCELDPCSL